MAYAEKFFTYCIYHGANELIFNQSSPSLFGGSSAFLLKEPLKKPILPEGAPLKWRFIKMCFKFTRALIILSSVLWSKFKIFMFLHLSNMQHTVKNVTLFLLSNEAKSVIEKVTFCYALETHILRVCVSKREFEKKEQRNRSELKLIVLKAWITANL